MASSRAPLRTWPCLVAAVVAAVAVVAAQSPPNPERAEEALHRGDRQYVDGRYREAHAEYSRALGTADVAITERALKGRIRSALRIAQFVVAADDAAVLKSARADDVDALTLYADALWGKGLFDEAETAYREAAERFPASARARFGLARSAATRTRLDEALALAEAARVDAPADAELAGFLGHVLERLRRYDQAAQAYEQSQTLLPKRLRNDSTVQTAKIKLLRGFRGREPLLVEGPADAKHTVPFRLVERKVVVTAKVNGSTIDVVLDTGSERVGISRATARRIGLESLSSTMVTGVGSPGVRDLSLSRLDTLEIGTLRVRNVPVSVGNMIAGAPPWQNESVSPLALGLSVIVDYKAQQVTFGRQLPAEAADVTLPMRTYRLPMIRGRLNDKLPAYFVVDTGGETMSISADLAGRIGPLPSRRIPLRVFGVNGRDRDAFLLPGVDLDFETLEYSKYSVAVLNLRAPSVLLGFELGGILGYRFLSPYRVTMDFDRSEVRLTRF